MSDAPVTPQGEGAGTVETPAERTFSQADLNKIAANEKRDGTKAGRQAAITELLEQAGAESVDEIISSYTEYKSVQEVTETEADKERKRAERLEARAKGAEARYENTLREYALRDQLREQGINSARLPLALKVAEMQNLEVDKDGNVSGVEAVVEAVKEQSPEWFGEARQRVDAPQTTGTGVQKPDGSGDAANDMGGALLGFLTQARNKNTSIFN